MGCHLVLRRGGATGARGARCGKGRGPAGQRGPRRERRWGVWERARPGAGEMLGEDAVRGRRWAVAPRDGVREGWQAGAGGGDGDELREKAGLGEPGGEVAAGGAAAGRGETEPPTLSQAARGKVTVAPSQAAGRVVP